MRRLTSVAVTVFAFTAAAVALDSITGRARVIDGDTIEIGRERIRLQGVDTPERYQRCRDARGQIYRCGDTATRALRRAIGYQPVRCDLKPGRGAYGRLIGICYSWDGRELNRWLVRQGYGVVDRRYDRRYLGEERGARAAKRGLHGGTFIAPWDWRRGKRLK